VGGQLLRGSENPTGMTAESKTAPRMRPSWLTQLC